MGYMRHNAIVVTSWSTSAIEAAVGVAYGLGLQVIGPSKETMNGYRSLLVCPDGSKEGWPESNLGDEKREVFRQWLRNQVYEDGSSSLEWVEVAYSNDDCGAVVESHAWPESAEEVA